MSSTLALSARPGDAVFSVGALLAALPGEKHHLTAFPAGNAGAEAESDAASLLGATHDTLALQGEASAKTVASAVETLLADHTYDNVLAPLGLAARPGDEALAAAVTSLKARFPGTRFLSYYELPYATQQRRRFPELAFARPIRGLAEADADAAMLQWKTRGSSAGAGGAVLQTKLAACALLDDVLQAALFPPDGDLPAPTDALEREAAARRGIGTREWVQLA